MQDSYPIASPPPLPPANPYAAPSADTYIVGYEGSLAEAEQTRNELIKHEASVKSIGSLFLLGALLCLLSAVVNGFTLFLERSLAGSEPAYSPLVLISVLAFGGLYFWIGRGLRRLDGRVRVVAIVFSAFGLLGFPIGTAISAYFIYLLASAKGKQVMSEEYQAIVAATPHIRYRSPWLIVALGVVALFIVVLLMIFSLAGR